MYFVIMFLQLDETVSLEMLDKSIAFFQVIVHNFFIVTITSY